MKNSNTKKCSRCKRVLPATRKYFSPNWRLKLGLGSWCRDCHSEHQKKMRVQNREKLNKQANEYYHRNKHRVAAKRNGFKFEDVQQQFRLQDGKCYYCKIALTEDRNQDHKTPKSKGGSNDADNLAIACPQCNKGKGDMTAQEYQDYLQGVVARLST